MKKRILIVTIFISTLVIIVSLFVTSLVRTHIYNSKNYEITVSGSDLFTAAPDKSQHVSINIVPRDGTWGKIFDFNNEGLTESNYTAYTYDFFIYNNTRYEVKTFKFKFVFDNEAYMAQAWNGALEIHQNVDGLTHVETIPDLRVYNPADYDLKFFYLNDEAFVEMQSGDYFIYYPSASMNALEMPIEAYEGTTPGIIMYVANGENIDSSSLTLEYTLYKSFTNDIFFMTSFICFVLWLIALVIFVITYLQFKKFKARHERDNKIINESIETFIGFIDAKDSYTKGHSKRVAVYTSLIAKEMGYSGEDLDKIYYMALLHDSGKIGVPDNILGKPGKLTKEEFEIIKSHTTRGGEILSNFKSLEHAGDGALYHHERYDGKGYPKGLKGEEIPLIARMICVADSFDAMNSCRVYRKNLSREYIISELENNKGTQFDPKIVDIFLNLIKEEKVKFEESNN